MVDNFILETGAGKVGAGIRAFLKNLLARRYFDALLVPLELPHEGRVAMALVSDPRLLERASPLAPVMMSNAARIVSEMTRVSPTQRKIGVILRPCELRALVELVKLKQASLEKLPLIVIDALGTYYTARNPPY